ncbi:hypothetical protein QUF58_04910 [Anaerolineales bacterium HSG24]|nr:hypothetical protein [Anaerolineales bacterium HSG24]
MVVQMETPPLLPEPNDDGKRRRLWQLKGMDLWSENISNLYCEFLPNAL